jgi:peptide/nickel transport system substrate-binding protein
MTHHSPASTRREFIKYSGSGLALSGIDSILGVRNSMAEVSPKRGGILQLSIGLGGLSDRLDPALIRAGNDALVCGQIYERLTRFDADWVLSPELAKSWDVTDDATKWTFHLRPDVRFHDGTPFTADDVAHSMRRILDKSLGSPHFGILSETLAPDGIQVVDALTIAFNLKAPNSLFALTVGDKKAGIVKAGTREVALQAAIGTGPFKIVSFTPGEGWEVKRHDGYWGEGLPYLDGARLINIADPAAELLSIRSGSTHIGTVRDFTGAQQILDSKNTEILEAKNAGFVYVAMNKSVPPFNDARVVEAIKLAVNRERMLSLALHGYGVLTTDVQLVHTSQFYPSDLGIRKQNVTRSRELLAAAGHPNGIELELFTSAGLLGMREHATVFAEMVAPAGIRAKITEWNPATYFSEIWLKKPIYVSFFNARHPSQMLSLLYTSNAAWPEQKFSNPRVDEIAKEAVRTLDPKKQAALYREAVRLISDGAGSSVASSVSKLFAQKRGVIAGVIPDGEETLLLKRAYFT